MTQETRHGCGAVAGQAARKAAALTLAAAAALLSTQGASAQTGGGMPAMPPDTCLPRCRSGYVCSPKGQCVSACNPPCGPNELCSATGECVAPGSPVPSPPGAVTGSAPAPPPSATTPAPPPPVVPPAPTPTVAGPAPPPPVLAAAPAPSRDADSSGAGGAETQRASGAGADARTHTGFHVTGALGGGSWNATYGWTTPGGNSIAESEFGGGLGMDLAVGGTPLPGLVIGGVIAGTVVPIASTQSISVNGASVPSHDPTNYVAVLSMVGPFVDWYFDATGGFHAQVATCLAHLSDAAPSVPNSGVDGWGFGFEVGTGYQWWIADRFTIGALARVQVAMPTVHASGGASVGTLLVAPALLLTTTYR